jgi:transcription elongation factor Elf1
MNTLASQPSCPFCGSINVEKKTESCNLPIPYASPAQFKTEQLICKECGMDTDISNSTEIQDAIDMATQASIPNMIDALTSNGWTLAKIEHSLDLPERTLSRWKSSPKLSKESIALLRILRTYPWIIQVADRKYEFNYAQGQVIVAAGQIISMVPATNFFLRTGCWEIPQGNSVNTLTILVAAFGYITENSPILPTLKASSEPAQIEIIKGDICA